MMGRMFREHPELQPTGKMTIRGSAICSADRMAVYAARRNPASPDVARFYLEAGERMGIRGDVAFCQALLDTKGWTEDPPGPPARPFAYAIWGGVAEAQWTESELKRRTEMHVQKLLDLCESREETELCWEDLDGLWAVPGRSYGRDITAIWRNMAALGNTGARKIQARDEAAQTQQESAAARDRKLAEEDLQWLAGRAWVPVPQPLPHRKVQWSELARVLRSWDSPK